MSAKLPEQYRLARNIHEGYEIRVKDTWHPVVAALHATAPLKVSSLTVDVNGVQVRQGFHPQELIMSRRPAGVS